MAFTEGLVICGTLWSFVPAETGLFVSIEFNILHWFFLSLLVESLLQLTVLGLKRLRFHNPVINEDRPILFEEVKADVGKRQRIELWFQKTDRDDFLSNTNSLFKTISSLRVLLLIFLENE
jgi:hypothetical protein